MPLPFFISTIDNELERLGIEFFNVLSDNLEIDNIEEI